MNYVKVPIFVSVECEVRRDEHDGLVVMSATTTGLTQVCQHSLDFMDTGRRNLIRQELDQKEARDG